MNAERVRRAERLGEPFETVADPDVLYTYDMLELRATQREDGAWEASVYGAQYEALAGCEVGGFQFRGLAATKGRAEQLARDAAAMTLAKWAGWREKSEREQAERAATR